MTWSPEQSNFPSDHYIVDFEIQQTFRRANTVTRNIFDYKRGNFGELRNYLTNNPLRTFHRKISMNVGFSGNIGF